MPHSHHTLRTYKKSSSEQRNTKFDTFVLVASIIYPLSVIPQIIEVFSGKTEGVSIISWVMFSFYAALFLSYGVKHRLAPMVIPNVLWLLADGAVVVRLII